ncbi:MAG: FtsX-like permease family protein [Lachnospiraceae bacterium]
MKSLKKDFFRELRKNRGRFISVFFIVLLGSAFFSGIRSSKPDMELSAEKYYDDTKLLDLKILSPVGFTEEDIDSIKNTKGVAKAYGAYTMDVLNTENEIEQAVKLISLNTSCNIPTVLDGRLPEKSTECFVDTRYLEKNDCKIGDKITLYTDSEPGLDTILNETIFTITGSGNLPYYMDVNRGVGAVGDGRISSFMIVLPEVFSTGIYTEVHVLAEGAKELHSFEDDYTYCIEKVNKHLEKTAEAADKIWYIQTRDSISSYINFQNDSDRIDKIGDVFPVIFFLVAALVSLTSMTRMIEEQRQQIGTLKALGCGNITIILQYFGFAMLPTVLGSITGVLIGEKFLPYVIIRAYSMLYMGLPDILLPYNMVQGGIAIFASILCTGAATLAACGKEFIQKPSELMRPLAPQSGKRILLERMGFIWKRLNFTQKSTMRNLFRYKKRFWMTIIGVGGCMGLVLVAFGLHDSIATVGDKQYEHLRIYQAAVTLDPLADEETIQSSISEMADYSGIKNTMRIYTQNVTVKYASNSLDVTVQIPEDLAHISDYIKLYNRISKKEYDFPKSGASISEKTAKSLKIKVGDMLEIQAADGSAQKIEIISIHENYIGNYLFFSREEYERIYHVQPEYNQTLLTYQDFSADEEAALGRFIMSLDGVKGILFTTTLIQQTDDMLDSLSAVVSILLIAAGLLAFVVLYNLNHINIAERKRELATLKVLGCYDNEVNAYIFRENIILTVLGILMGFLIGILLHQYVIISLEVDLIMFGRSIALLSFFSGSVLTMIFSLVVNIVMSKRIKGIDMIESLKSVE